MPIKPLQGVTQPVPHLGAASAMSHLAPLEAVIPTSLAPLDDHEDSAKGSCDGISEFAVVGSAIDDEPVVTRKVRIIVFVDA